MNFPLSCRQTDGQTEREREREREGGREGGMDREERRLCMSMQTVGYRSYHEH